MVSLRGVMDKFTRRLQRASSSWAGLVLTTLLLAQGYVLLEWVFYVTKPSFLDLFTLLDKLAVLVTGAALAALLALLGLGVLGGLGRVFRLNCSPLSFFGLVSLLPAFILACLALILIDNFTYTLFSFGISTAQGAVRVGYGVLFVLLLGWSEWQVLGLALAVHTWLAKTNQRRWAWFVIGIWLVFGLVLVLLLGGGEDQTVMAGSLGTRLTRQPNILWITGDGLSDEWLSLYGYERDNTPFLRTLAQESLIVENAFANAANSTGSVVSMLTGKTALETRVLFSPDILHGIDAYQHLPGILRSYGYFTLQYGFPFYVDAYIVNMQEGFDVVNELSLTGSPIRATARRYLPETVAYFIFEAGSRLGDRLQHIFFIQAMLNPNQVVLSKVLEVDDQARMAALLGRLEALDQPTFIHIHMMGTHGPRFSPNQQYFSAGKTIDEQTDWDMDFYDDAVRQFDTNLSQIITTLERQGLLENTLLIVGSDHGILYDQRQRIPLLIRFPGAEITGTIQGNVQNIDVAPTILDYLGLSQPDWMSGHSLLAGEPVRRYIYGARVAYLEQNNKGRFRIDLEKTQPPFYQVGTVSVVDCSRWYELDLVTLSLARGVVDGHTQPCPVEQVITAGEAYDLLLAYLRENGYDIATLEGLSAESLLVEP